MPARILVVDDDPGARSTIVKMLRRAGYDVADAGSFDEGLKAVRANPPDLLITDIRLREYNGLQLLIWMPDTVRGLVVTGFADPVIEAEARAQGARLLLKPLTSRVLVKAVEDALARPAGATKRRWPRKHITTIVAADVNGSAARILDISYGGVRVELEGEPTRGMADTFTMAVADVVVPVDLIWDRPADDHGWTCGLAVASLNQEAADTWQGFVDRVA